MPESDFSGIASHFDTSAAESSTANYAPPSWFEPSSDGHLAYLTDAPPATYFTSGDAAGEQDWSNIGLGVQGIPPSQRLSPAEYPYPTHPSEYQYRSLEQIVEANAAAPNLNRFSTVAPRSVVLYHDQDPHLLGLGGSVPPTTLPISPGAQYDPACISGARSPPVRNDSHSRGNGWKEHGVPDTNGFSEENSSRARQHKPIPAARKEKALNDLSTPWAAGASGAEGGQTGLRRLAETAEAIAMGVPVEASVESACSTCAKVCRNASALRHHERTHDVEKTNKHLCGLCERGFSYPKDLRRHIRAKHPDAATPAEEFSCPKCGANFSRKDHWQRHLHSKSHTGSIASDVRSEVGVRNPARGAIPQRRSSNMRSGRPLIDAALLSPTSSTRSHRRKPTYADVVRYGGQLSAVSSPTSQSSAFFSQPSSPFPNVGSSTANTSLDEAFLDPQLRQGSQYFSNTRFSSPTSAHGVPPQYFGPPQR